MIPFVTKMAFDYGRAQQVSPLIRRLIARNPGPFTYTGTGAHIVGRGQVAVIDPGPDLPSHLDAILEATEGETISHIFVTHSHLDHSPLARPLAERTGAVIYAGGEAGRASGGDDRLEAGDDLDFRPDVALIDRRRFHGPGWTIEAVATPGHTANHYAFALEEENALFPGDCVMGWSTSVISPPDGDMGEYLDSLDKIRRRRFSTLWPAHGPAIREAGPFLAAYIGHRLVREHQILNALEAFGPATVRRLVAVLYADVDRRLHPAACHTVLAHLIQLAREGRVESVGLPTIGAVYRPVRLRRAA
ncbi:MAG TPA: MBL fold metallo-hydrolase [Caulobacteraceae bacterium]|jgi:glyoxylase-like metal-dependent hydrolase (beta-lactamase superfamily II)|nr:MBL fold metallo-hydrolase [Caulobacteraceae bacterium]